MTKQQLRSITRLAAQEITAQEIASRLRMTMHDAYCNDAFCIAFAAGYTQRQTLNRIVKSRYPTPAPFKETT